MSQSFFIPEEEFDERIKQTQQAMRLKEIDLLLAFSTESEPAYVRYYSDYWPSFETAGVLIPANGEPALLIGPESLTLASARSKIKRIIQLIDFRESSQPEYPGSKLPTWSDLFAEFKPRSFGIAGWHMFPHPIMEGVRAAAGSCKIFNADEVVRGICMKKSENELNCLREAARISELGFKAVLENIKPGMTEVQLAGLATGAMLANGAEATGYPVWCCSGPNSTQAISRPTQRKVQPGEIIHFSVGAKVAGYSGSIGRPVVLENARMPPEIHADRAGCDEDDDREHACGNAGCGGGKENARLHPGTGLRSYDPLRSGTRLWSDGMRIPLSRNVIEIHPRRKHGLYGRCFPRRKGHGLPMGRRRDRQKRCGRGIIFL